MEVKEILPTSFDRIKDPNWEKKEDLTEDDLSYLYTNTRIPIRVISEEYDVSINEINSYIKAMQYKGTIGRRHKYSKRNMNKTEAIPKVERTEPSLEELLKDIDTSFSGSSDISTKHKEMLIEILYSPEIPIDYRKMVIELLHKLL